MKIEDNQIKDFIQIKDIEIGESFIFENVLYVRIDNGCINVETMFPYLVLNLADNKLDSIKEDVLVKPVKTKIVIE